jgi:hypothetical protein
VDTEIIATTALKERIAFCDGLQSYINERDKEPLWDGHIYVFPKGSNNKDKLIGRVAVQVKGKKKAISQKTVNMSYSVEVGSLKKYLQDGGVIYFVVAFTERYAKTIFYKVLLPFDLQRAIDNSGGKKSRNINLQRLPDNCDSIRQLFIAFIEDKKRQASQIVWSEKQAAEAVMAGGTMKFHISPSAQSKNYYDMMKEATLQDFYMYVETKDGVEFPFGKIERAYSSITTMKMDFPVYVNDEKFYDNISYGYENGKAYIYIGKVIKLPFADEGEKPSKHTFKFSLSGSLNSRIADSNFILAISENPKVCIGEKISFEISLDNSQEVSSLRTTNDVLKKIRAAFDYFGMLSDFDMSNLSEMDNRNIDILIRASLGNQVFFKEENLPRIFYENKKIGSITIRTVAKQEEDSNGYRLLNAFYDDAHVRLEYVDDNGKKVTVEPWSLFIHMKADDFLCSNVDYLCILKSISSMDVLGKEVEFKIPDTEKTIGANSMLLEVISAYDSQSFKDKKLLQFAIDLAEAIETGSLITMINKYQIIRRLRILSHEEIADLVNLRRKNEDCLITCCIAIILGEIDTARTLLKKMSDTEKRRITEYPIYSLLLSDEAANQKIPLKLDLQIM